MRYFFRWLRAELRDLRVLWGESYKSLLIFAAINFIGAAIFHYLYIQPDWGRHPGWGEALHGTFALIFFEIVFPLPDEWYLQLLFFLLPIVGLTVAADGIIRFGTALINKQARGQKWQVAMASTMNQHVIICGLGKVGFRTCQELLKFGRDVVAIERNEQGRFVEAALALNIPVVIADATFAETLHKAGVEKADAIIPATEDELTNLKIGLEAREVNPEIKVVLRMFDEELAQRVEKGFGIRTAYSTSALAAPVFAAAAMRLNVEHSFYVGETLLNVTQIEISARSKLAGWTIEQLEKRLDLSVVLHQNNERSDIHPAPTCQLQPNDSLLVLASLPVLKELNELNR